jgi:hypothetical protein
VPPNKDFGEHLDFDVQRVFSVAQPIPAEEFLTSFLTLNADGLNADMNVNGSGTPQKFQLKAPAGKSIHISRLIWEIQDGPIDYRFWFGNGAALTNGCTVEVVDTDLVTVVQGFESQASDSGVLKKTIDFAHLASQDLSILQSTLNPTDPDVMVIRWSLFKAGYSPVLRAGQALQFTINDNLTGMDVFRVTAQGRIFDDE